MKIATNAIGDHPRLVTVGALFIPFHVGEDALKGLVGNLIWLSFFDNCYTELVMQN